MQQFVLLMLLGGCSVHCCGVCSGRDRHTVRRWRDWLRERSEVFTFCLRSRHPDFARLAEYESFWRNVIDALSLEQAMALLDRDVVVP